MVFRKGMRVKKRREGEITRFGEGRKVRMRRKMRKYRRS